MVCVISDPVLGICLLLVVTGAICWAGTFLVWLEKRIRNR